MKNDVEKFKEVAELANEMNIQLIFGYTLPNDPEKFTAPFGVQIMIDILNGMKASIELNAEASASLDS